jgi:hypothetical protein
MFHDVSPPSFKLSAYAGVERNNSPNPVAREGGEDMPKRCRPPARVRLAGRILSTSGSAKAKSKAGKILQLHQAKNH